MRPKTLCVFDVMFQKGQRYMIEASRMDYQDLLTEVKLMGTLFGNLGIDLSDEDTDFVAKKVLYYVRNITKLQGTLNLNTPDYFAVDDDWLEFRRSFSYPREEKK